MAASKLPHPFVSASLAREGGLLASIAGFPTGMPCGRVLYVHACMCIVYLLLWAIVAIETDKQTRQMPPRQIHVNTRLYIPAWTHRWGARMASLTYAGKNQDRQAVTTATKKKTRKNNKNKKSWLGTYIGAYCILHIACMSMA
jgi:hypothetical protein